jgi:hypothetical protein
MTSESVPAWPQSVLRGISAVYRSATYSPVDRVSAQAGQRGAMQSRKRNA